MTLRAKNIMFYSIDMTIHVSPATLETLLATAYPEGPEALRREVLLDLTLISHWLLEQVELDSPALKELAVNADVLG